MATAIFDLDGTITKRDTYIPFLFLCLKEFGIRGFSVALLPFSVLLYRCGVITNSRLKELFLKAVLSGLGLEQLKPVVEKFVSGILNHRMNEPVLERIKFHLDRKHDVILATASFDIYVLKLAEKIGIQRVVCTRAEIQDGMVTGRICGKNCHGPEKATRLEELLGSSALTGATFYSDHHSDLPLLKRVKQGILVNPGIKTRMLARKFNFGTLQSAV